MTHLQELHEDFFSSRFMRVIFTLVMVTAFSFGFMDLFVNGNFERLHIFLFNLTTGGSIILYFTENRTLPSWRNIFFFLLSIVYAVAAYLHQYLLAVAITLILFVTVESIRIQRFSFFPWIFFKVESRTSEKFHQASLLCLSLALLIASVVILNEKFYHWFSYEKLTLNVFFLGFSFPVSLITMSVMFNFLQEEKNRVRHFVEHIIFWVINLGVIVFFIFIILKIYILEFIVASILALAVITTFYLFFRHGVNIQPKKFLISGISFLLMTAITGILYIPIKKFPEYYESNKEFLLMMHSYLSLYGWNLSGLLVIMRWKDFPIRLNSLVIILFHWIIIFIIAPLGKRYAAFAIAAMIGYALFLAYFFISKKDDTVIDH